jgi:hypothetical protein
MSKFKVVIASTIYYEAEVEAELIKDIHNQFDNGDLDFTTWKEIDLESSVFNIVELLSVE